MPYGNPNNVWFDVTVLTTTDRAILVSHEDTDEEVWLPRSQVLDHDGDLEAGNYISLELSTWFAAKKGLI